VEAEDVDDIRVAWVNQGASTEDPWTLAQFQARDRVERIFAPRVTTTFVEKVELGPHAAATIDRLVRAGHELVIATSAPLEADVLHAASRHPLVAFEQARGAVTTSNVSTYTGAHEESAYLTGLAAGALSDSGRVAYVAPAFEAETLRILNGFALGVGTTRPGSVVLVAWTDVWWDPPAERRAAELLVASGADVIATGCTSTATGELAQELDLPWCAQDADLSGQFGDVWVTAPRILPGGHYCRRVSDRLTGVWHSEAHVGGLADGFTDIAPLGLRVPADVRRGVMDTRARILAGHRIPDLGVPFGPAPPARPGIDGDVERWSARTHASNVEVVLPPTPEPPVAPPVGPTGAGR